MSPLTTLKVLGQVAVQGHEAAVAITLGIHRRGLELFGNHQIVRNPVIQSSGVLAEAEHALSSVRPTVAVCFHRLPVLDGHKPALFSSDYIDVVNTVLNFDFGEKLTSLECLDQLRRGGRFTDALDKLPIILLGLQKHTMNEVAIVIAK